MNLDQEINWLLGEKYNGEENPDFFSDVEKLKAGEPLAFLIGSIPFLNTKIHLDSRPLIPRTETEFWVEKVITEIKNQHAQINQPIKVLDLCAGSGCIGVAIAKAIPKTEVDFIELEIAHLPTITKNCFVNGIKSGRVRIMPGDLFGLVFPAQLKTYDFIVSNPPYIDPAINRTEASVKEYEPKLALYGGNLGLELIHKVIKESPNYLRSGGQLWLEHEPEQVESILEIASPNFSCHTQKDQYGYERFSKLVLQ